MKHFTRKQIEESDRKFRLNLINSITGIKPANLIGTKSNDGKENVAIFSSVVHLGSNPALLGFILRPYDEIPRNTYENILENNLYTINHVPVDLAKQAHYTSVKFDRDTSEFEKCKLTPEYLSDFEAPFVQESPIKIGLSHQESIPIKTNNTTLVIGQIEHIFIHESLLNEKGYLDLEQSNSAGISGLNRYYSLSLKGEFPYARITEFPEFD